MHETQNSFVKLSESLLTLERLGVT